MTFVVEDGTGLSNANALISVSFADEYHTDRGRADWTGADSVKQAAIVRATDYVCTRFRIKYPKVEDAQSLSFPIVLNNEAAMPLKMQQAVAEYALRAMSKELAPDMERGGDRLVSTMEKVGPLEERKSYLQTGSGINPIIAYPAADMLMLDFIDNTVGNRVIR